MLYLKKKKNKILNPRFSFFLFTRGDQCDDQNMAVVLDMQFALYLQHTHTRTHTMSVT